MLLINRDGNPSGCCLRSVPCALRRLLRWLFLCLPEAAQHLRQLKRQRSLCRRGLCFILALLPQWPPLALPQGASVRGGAEASLRQHPMDSECYLQLFSLCPL